MSKSNVIHNDGWQNFFTGMGVAGVDRKQSTGFAAECRLQEVECRNLYTYSGLARKIASRPVLDGFRKKFTIDGDTDNILVNEEFKRLKAWKHIIRAGTWARAYGGAIVVVFANDGRLLDEPLDENNIRNIEKIEVHQRWRCSRVSWYLDPKDPKYAETETWLINPVTQFPRNFTVHETRCIIFDGEDVDPIVRQGNYWWGDSVYQSIFQRLRGLGEAYSNIEHIIGEFILLVQYMKGLSMKIGENPEDVINRVQIQNLTRHLMGTYLADADGEKVERQSASVAGLREIMEVLMMAVSAECNIPIRKLFGTPIQAAGLGKDGDEETQDYDNYVITDRQENREHQVEQLCRLIMLAKQGPFKGKELPNWKINWPPLREEPMSVQLDNKAKQKDIDRGYWDMGSIDENEIRENRFGGDSYSHDMVLKKRDMIKENEPEGDLEEKEELKSITK